MAVLRPEREGFCPEKALGRVYEPGPRLAMSMAVLETSESLESFCAEFSTVFSCLGLLNSSFDGDVTPWLMMRGWRLSA